MMTMMMMKTEEVIEDPRDPEALTGKHNAAEESNETCVDLHTQSPLTRFKTSLLI